MKAQVQEKLHRLTRRRRKGPKPNYPPVALNNPGQNKTQLDFASNEFNTTKYNFFNFLPKVLFEQFRKATNFYFLLICIIVLIPVISPLTPGPSIAGLIFVLVVAMLREAYEDIRRFAEDRKVNLRMYDVLAPHDGSIRQKLSRDLKVGDLVYLRSDQSIPADLIILASGNPEGVAYVQTSQLDGETNLKPKKALPQTSSLNLEGISKLEGLVYMEPPNHHLYGFQGKMSINNVDYPLTDDQLFLRATVMRNTPWAIGVIGYAGIDTKSALNSKPPPSKFSSLDIKFNKAVIGIFLFKLTLVLLMCILGGVWETRNAADNWYVGTDDSSAAVYGIKIFFGWFVLLSYFIPLSLAVSLEVVKLWQALTMTWDENMALDKSNVADTGMNAKTSNLNDELALVRYIFSDKTGTLTENKMEFKQASIHGVLYPNAGEGQIGTTAKESGGNAHWELEFLRLLALSHTIVPSTDDKGEIQYQASSPDEEALVKAAKLNGATFIQRNNDGSLIRVFDRDELYPTLIILEFTSSRRRMSIVVRTPEGRIVLYSKGADSVIFERLAPGQDDLKNQTLHHLEEFSKIGLRTLALGYRELSPSEFETLNTAYLRAANTIGNREEEIDKVCDQLESNLLLLGPTAIEDRLQQYVPETIEALLKAGVHLWVITGDKQATAINIGYSCRLLTPQMDVVKVNAETTEECKRILEQNVNKYCQEGNTTVVAMVIDGATLKFVINDHPLLFLKFATRCKSIICNRVTPIQKAKVVRLVRDNIDTVTLAIGDGANDVSMIQEAHVGVGIFGNEGTQAARSADFAIRMFCHLKRLMFVHGRYSLIRNAGLIQYSFYKNIAVFACQFWYSFYSCWSTQTLFNAYIMAIFNIVLTSVPPVFYGAFEKDISEDIIEANPEAFGVLRLFSYLNLGMWVIGAVYHSLVFYFGSYLIWSINGSTIYSNGQVSDLFVFGNYVLTVGIVTVLLKIALETKTWNFLVHIAIWGSMIVYFLMLIILDPLDETQESIYAYTFKSGSYWLWLPVGVGMALLPDFTLKYIERAFFPKAWQIYQEMYSTNPPGPGQELVLYK